ncbi:MAG: TIGR02466 family protein [Hyphomicrobiaceae bacterium]
MPRLDTLFVTRIKRAELGARARDLIDGVRTTCLAIAEEDRAGQAWCREHGYRGYTSYASLDDLVRRASVFDDLVRRIDPKVAAFARTLDLDLGGRRLVLDSLWINVLEPGGHHTAHIHPHAVVSGTFYVDVPKGASAIRFEDPRLTQMMAAPPRKAQARMANRTFVSVEPKVGTLLLWESWLRHEVPVNNARRARISLSFNYRWG